MTLRRNLQFRQGVARKDANAGCWKEPVTDPKNRIERAGTACVAR